jgi:hypothetical protein
MKLTTRLFALSVLLAALPLAAQTYDWSATGSTGSYDYPSQYKFATAGTTLKFGSFQSGTISFRYPVTNTFGTGQGSIPGWTTLHATYTDDSSSGSVTVALYKVDKCDFTETQLCSITSSDGSNTPACTTCTFNSTDVDFANYYYYVLVTLNRSNTTANQQIHQVAIN